MSESAVQKTALFLGAGFSYEFGMPLVWELTKEMRNWLTPEKFRSLNDGWRLQDNGNSEKTVSMVCELLSRDDLHYEALVGAIEVYSNRHENRSIRNELEHVRQWLLELIYMFLHQRHVLNKAFFKTSIQMHRGLLSLIDSHTPLWIFSLNHDLIIELFAAEFSIPLRTGFSKSTSTLYLDEHKRVGLKFASIKRDEILKAQSNYFTPGERGINLLKIHGGLDIFGFDDLKQYLCLEPDDRSIDGYLEALSQLDPQERPLFKPTNEILGWDENGEIQFLRRSILSGVFKYDRAKSTQIVSQDTLGLFKSSLNHVEKLIILGYGLGDQHINVVLREWIEFSSKRSITIIDPRITKRPSFLDHVPEQVEIQQVSSLDFFAAQPQGQLTAAEKGLRELRRVAREEMDEKARAAFSSGFKNVIKKIKQISNTSGDKKK